MAEMATEKRSYLAMLLSLIIPGLGQLFLRKPLKGLLLFLGVASAAGIIYVNSLPVHSWRDVARVRGLEKWWDEQQLIKKEGVDSADSETALDPVAETEESKRRFHVLTITDDSKFAWLFKLLLPHAKDGDKLMYRPSWKFKVTGLIQGIIFWIYAIYDGWRGERGFNKRAFNKRLKRSQESHVSYEGSNDK